MKRAKPEGKIIEVVDDMVDAVAGTEPLVLYIKESLRIFIFKNSQIFFFFIVEIRASHGRTVSFSSSDFHAD